MNKRQRKKYEGRFKRTLARLIKKMNPSITLPAGAGKSGFVQGAKLEVENIGIWSKNG